MSRHTIHSSRLYKVRYSCQAGTEGTWEFYAKDQGDALSQAKELMPLSYKILSVYLSEEWE